MILISKYLVPKGYLGITIYPFVLLKSKVLKSNIVLVNHEKIHLKQQKVASCKAQEISEAILASIVPKSKQYF